MAHGADRDRPANRVLRALPAEEYARLRPHLRRAEVRRGHVLFEQGSLSSDLCFVESGTVSLLTQGLRGEAIEVALVGHEGAVGVSMCLGVPRSLYHARVEIGGAILRLDVNVCERSLGTIPAFQREVLQYVYFLLAQVSQSALCNRFHTASERLARWVLSSRDRVESDTLDLTQELLGQMLGTPRPWVTRVVRDLQGRGFIEYRRGRLSILDRSGLERAACDCYRVVRAHLRDLWGQAGGLSTR